MTKRFIYPSFLSVPGANGDIFCGTLKLAEIEAKIMEPWLLRTSKQFCKNFQSLVKLLPWYNALLVVELQIQKQVDYQTSRHCF